MVENMCPSVDEKESNFEDLLMGESRKYRNIYGTPMRDYKDFQEKNVGISS